MNNLATKSRGGRNLGLRPRNRRSTLAMRLEASAIKPVTAKRIKLQEYDKKVTDDLFASVDNASIEYLAGSAAKSRLVQVPVANLDLWLDNPRTFCACSDDEKTQTIELSNLLNGHKTANLAVQLAHNGGIPEALIGIAKPNGRVEIIDGARRSTASKVLAGVIDMPENWSKKIRDEIAETLAKRAYPKTLPVKVFDGVTREQLQSLLAIKHSSGQLQWGSLQRGQFAYSLLCERTKMELTCDSIEDLRRVWKELSQKDQDVLKSVAHTCGSRPDRLRPYIMAYVANAYYCGAYDVSQQKERFTYFAKFYAKKWFRDMADGIQPTLRSQKEIKDFLAPDTSIEQKFMEWIANELITDCVQVDFLHVIMNDEEAYSIFLKDGAKEAEKFLMKDSGNALVDALVEVQAATKLSLKSPDGGELREHLRKLKGALAFLESDLGEAL